MDEVVDRSGLNPVVRRVLERADAKRRGVAPSAELARAREHPTREVVVLTKSMILAGRSNASGSFTKRQMELLGVGANPSKGWIERLVGAEVWKDSYEEFLMIRVDTPSGSFIPGRAKVKWRERAANLHRQAKKRPNRKPPVHGKTELELHLERMRAARPASAAQTERVAPGDSVDSWREQE